MTSYIALVVVIVVIGLVLAIAKRLLRSASPSSLPYRKATTLFSAAERSFLGVLDQAVGREYRVFGKVRVADVVNVAGVPNRSAWQRAFNLICAKHFDYVICSISDLAIVCVVELDDKSHQAKARQKRDQFIADLCRTASLPLINVPARASYGAPDLRAKFLMAISRPEINTEIAVPCGGSQSSGSSIQSLECAAPVATSLERPSSPSRM
jgi:hypothetical protein